MRVLWTRRLPCLLQSVHLARETGHILVRDAGPGLSLWDQQGESKASISWPGLLLSAATQDATAFVGADARRVQWLGEQLGVVWEKALSHKPTAVALAPLGQWLALSDESGTLGVFDHAGRECWTATTPGPLRHLAWIPETGHLVAAAEFGLVCLFDAKGRLLWRDGLVAHVGSVSVSGDGSRIILACFTEGIRVYGLDQPRPTTLPETIACRTLSASYSTEVMLAVSLDGSELSSHDKSGRRLTQGSVSSTVGSIALDALGGVALSGGGGELTAWDTAFALRPFIV